MVWQIRIPNVPDAIRPSPLNSITAPALRRTHGYAGAMRPVFFGTPYLSMNVLFRRVRSGSKLFKSVSLPSYGTDIIVQENHMPGFPTTRLTRAPLIVSTTLLLGCAHPRTPAPLSPAEPGRTRFETHCAGCHLNEGPYMMGEAPPLDGSAWVAGPENLVIKIVLHGLHGPIEVSSKSYNQEMPGFAPILTDADIASLLTYVRRRFGGASTPTSEAAVTLIRAANRDRTNYWTVKELIKDP